MRHREQAALNPMMGSFRMVLATLAQGNFGTDWCSFCRATGRGATRQLQLARQLALL